MSDTLVALVERYQLLVVAHPVSSAIYLALLLVLGFLSIRWICRQQANAAFWSVTGLILTNYAFSLGQDTQHHVYRIVALAEQARHGNVDLMLANPATGEALPTFVFYSFVPYLLPTLLNLVGMPALVALKLSLGLQFVAMSLGLQALVKATTSPGSPRQLATTGFLAAILFVGANYVYELWYERAALAEISVYMLLPWVVLRMVSPGSARSLTALFFVQICMHPIVFLQGLVCEAIVAYGVSRLSPAELMRRISAPLAIALVLASPFWLPQFLWKDFILGIAGLPSSFADSFLSIGALLDPRLAHRNIGWCLPAAVVLTIVVYRLQLPGRFWAVAAAFAATMAIQTVYLRGLAMHLPVLDLSLFVWRLMFPAAFLAFGALLAGRGVMEGRAVRILAPLALLSIVTMTMLAVSAAPLRLTQMSATEDDRGAYATYLRESSPWGIGEFLPNYARIADACEKIRDGKVQRATYAELRGGFRADQPFVAVRHGPIGFVDYSGDGQSLQPGACGDDLVLGPLGPNAGVRVSERNVRWLLYLRAIELPLGFLIILLLMPRNLWPRNLWQGRRRRSLLSP